MKYRLTDILKDAKSGGVEAGRFGIFTPMYFILARKPEQGGAVGEVLIS